MNFANATIVGRVTAPVEIKQTTGGLDIANFSVAVNDLSKGKDNATVSYFEVAVFGKKAGPCSEYLVKGSEVLVSGSLKIETYGKRDGTTGTKVLINADKIEFGPKPQGGQSSAPRSESRPSQQRGPEPSSGSTRVTEKFPEDRSGGSDPDDLPFAPHVC